MPKRAGPPADALGPGVRHPPGRGAAAGHRGHQRIVRAQTDGGTRAADAATPDEAAELFESDGLKRAVKTFLSEGPGKATFSGE